MQDQVMALKDIGINACFLGSAQTNPLIKDEIIQNKYCIVYVTPEFITEEQGYEFLAKIYGKLALIAIDEAQCISLWGHNFRKSYSTLGFFKKYFPDVPIIALTSNATKEVEAEICCSLSLKNPHIVRTSLDRQNLSFYVNLKTEIIEDLMPHLINIEGSAIIYTLTKKDAVYIADVLIKYGITCKAYHADLEMKIPYQEIFVKMSHSKGIRKMKHFAKFVIKHLQYIKSI
jgi:RecQ family ATP-dependent DNA helicase